METRTRAYDGTLTLNALRYKYNQTFTRWIRRSKDVFAQFDRDFRIVYANPTFCRTFGVTHDSAFGYAADRLNIDDALTAQWQELLLKTVAHRKEHTEELWLPTQQGLRCFRMRVVPEFRRREGTVESIWTNGRDITDVRGTESVLGEKEARFKGIVSNVPGLVFQLSRRSFDHAPKFQYVSNGAIALCGMTPARMEVAPEEFIALINPDDRAGFYGSMNLSMDTQDNWSWEGRLSGDGGSPRWVSLRATPRRKEGDGVLWDGIMLDITDSKRNADKLRESEEFLRDLCVRVAMVREEEKRAIAHEIHDELGQLLTALKLDLSCLRELDGLGARAHPKLQRMESLADEILHRVRDIASTLRPKVLELGLAPAIEWLAQEFMYRTGAHCVLVLDGLDLCRKLDDAKSTAIFRIVQESLTNVTRHSRASHVHISFSPRPQGLLLSIHDDGVGFDPSVVEFTKIGLSGIRERAIILGAELRIDSSPEGGTTVEARIPFESLGLGRHATGKRRSRSKRC